MASVVLDLTGDNSTVVDSSDGDVGFDCVDSTDNDEDVSVSGIAMRPVVPGQGK